MAIDYQALLKKYMKHIDWHEGTTFVSSLDNDFTTEEATELRILDVEIEGEKGRQW